MAETTTTSGVARPMYPIESVDNALKLMMLLQTRARLRVSDCARELGIARSSAHRLLAMLEYRGFIERAPDGQGYRSGSTLVALGLTAVNQLDIRRLARPHLEWLARAVGETVNLHVLEGSSVRFVDSIESPRALRIAGRVGTVRPAHCTSAGKAILATLARRELDDLYPDEELPTLTERSISTRAALYAELDQVRERAYALNAGESDPEITGVGVAIPGRVGDKLAGFSVSKPSSRVDGVPLPEMAGMALRAARAAAGVAFDGAMKPDLSGR